MKVILTEPGVAGSYVVEERREDGRVVLRPEPEPLSAVVAETEDRVFWNEAELFAHLDRVAASEDDLPPDEGR